MTRRLGVLKKGRGMGQENHKGSQPEGEDSGPSSEAGNTPSGVEDRNSSGSDNQKNKDEPNPAGDSSGNKPPRRRKWFWAATAMVLIVAVLAVRYFNEGKAAPEVKAVPPAAAITAAPSKIGDINIYIEALGTVTPTYTVTVFSQVTGRVLGVYYHEGQMVREGDPLIDIDPRPYQALLIQAEGTLDHDLGLLAQARIDLQRYRAAYARNAIAKQQLDDQEQIVVQFEGSVKADQGTVAYDQAQLSYCHIVAPITGRVGLRLVDPGNTIFAGSSFTLVVITQLQPITVVFNVSEDDLPRVQTQLSGGRALKVDAFDRSNETLIESGMLTSLDNIVDTTTGTVKFRGEFSNRNFSLFPNQFVNARLLLKTLHRATLVPSAAVQHNGTAAFVYIVKPDNTVALQPVTVLTGNEQVTAVKGVNPGVNLATSGFDRLENDARVLVRPQTPGQKQGQQNAAAVGGGSSPGGTPVR
jgi:multidrug efflux system membrane fusion protein